MDGRATAVKTERTLRAELLGLAVLCPSNTPLHIHTHINTRTKTEPEGPTAQRCIQDPNPSSSETHGPKGKQQHTSQDTSRATTVDHFLQRRSGSYTKE